MPISPWAKGQISPTWTILLTRDGGQVMDLTGVNADQLSLKIYTSSQSLIGTGGGPFTIQNANPGIVRYTPIAADSNTTGALLVRVVVDFNGVSPDMSDYINWQVNP